MSDLIKRLRNDLRGEASEAADALEAASARIAELEAKAANLSDLADKRRWEHDQISERNKYLEAQIADAGKQAAAPDKWMYWGEVGTEIFPYPGGSRIAGFPRGERWEAEVRNIVQAHNLALCASSVHLSDGDRKDADRWICVCDALPEHGQIVLAYGPKLGMDLCIFYEKDQMFYDGDYFEGWVKPPQMHDQEFYRITHWIPAPDEPAKQQAQEG